MTKKNIFSKLLIICILLLTLPAGVVGYRSYKTAKEELDIKGRMLLKNSVHQALQLIDAKQLEVARGNLTVSTAQEEVKGFIVGYKNEDGTRTVTQSIDIGEHGYIYVLDSRGNILAHPTLDGENLWEAVDKENPEYYFIQDIITKAKDGGGFTEYNWELPNSSEIAPKIVYSMYEQQWDWIVVAGSYKMDFNIAINNIMDVLIFTLVISLILGLLITIVFTRHISNPIKKISLGLESISKGDLSIKEIKVKNNDETGMLAASCNIMVKNLRDLVKSVKESSNRVLSASISLSEISNQTAAATNEIAQTVSEIAHSSSEQARDVEDGALQINELSKDIEHIANLSEEMDKESNRTNALTKDGLDVVEMLIEKSNENKAAAERVRDIVFRVDESTQRISVITDTISQIAEQTNLLALNASIEAARAGEAGRGFAVVADEIRKLAEEVSNSAMDINEILDGIKENSKVAVESMEDAQTIVEQQTMAVENTRKIFNSISESILNLIKRISKVADSSINMNEKRERIINMIENLSAISQETAAATEEVSASTEEQTASIQQIASHSSELKELANELLKIVNTFKID